MRFSSEFVAKAVAGSKAEAAILAPVVRKCAIAGSAKSKTGAAAEDIEQELWLFLMKNSTRLDDEYNIEPYLIETARKMSLAFSRRFSMYGTAGSEDLRSDGLAGMSGSEVGTEEEAAEQLVGLTSQQQAMTALMKASVALREAASRNDDDQFGVDDMLKKAAGAKAKKAPTLGADHKELRKIRRDCHLTQVEMAAKCGVKLPTYQSYEYGKTETVNPAVMEAARKIRANPEFSYVASLYKRKSMAVIAAKWAKRLQIPIGHVTELANVLGVDKATVSRWLDASKNVVPDMDMMATYERRVNSEERWLASRKIERDSQMKARRRVN